MWAVPYSVGLAVFVFMSSAAHSHETDEDHDHTAGKFFCEGGGYNLYCGEGHKLSIDDAWFGRFVDDDYNCVDKNATTTLPTLTKDCGGPAMDDIGQFCSDTTGSCTLEVLASKISVSDSNACPGKVPRYLYLEFHCESILAGSGAMKIRSDSLFYLMVSFVLLLLNVGTKG